MGGIEFITFISTILLVIFIMIGLDVCTRVFRYIKYNGLTLKEAFIRVYKDFFYLP